MYVSVKKHEPTNLAFCQKKEFMWSPNTRITNTGFAESLQHYLKSVKRELYCVPYMEVKACTDGATVM